MAHFTINLPNNQQADVRRGKIIKKQNLLKLLRPRSIREENIGYIVKVIPAPQGTHEYHFMKTTEGKWLQHGEHNWLKEGEGNINLAIKNAIDEFELSNRVKKS